MDIEVPVKKILPPLLRIKKDSSSSVNQEVLNLVYDKTIINDWEFNFYSDTKQKRKLSYKQKDNRIKINQKIIRGLLRKVSSNAFRTTMNIEGINYERK